ncbi:hypothetical protein Nepgr_022066 [Nepenthes gracilis]|uniref:Uncharacterized protein n=1 Tax=Nepenthes gracilis TaxID=150966 RepID=A0AAD3SYQ6_NEPGR|nr:hypothetical protein Nepgr_022066 [Nepenthes gracilis]
MGTTVTENKQKANGKGGASYKIMNAKSQRRNFTENGDIQHAFEMGLPELLLQQLRNVAKKKKAEIPEFCRLHQMEFTVEVDEL